NYLPLSHLAKPGSRAGNMAATGLAAHRLGVGEMAKKCGTAPGVAAPIFRRHTLTPARAAPLPPPAGHELCLHAPSCLASPRRRAARRRRRTRVGATMVALCARTSSRPGRCPRLVAASPRCLALSPALPRSALPALMGASRMVARCNQPIALPLFPVAAALVASVRRLALPLATLARPGTGPGAGPTAGANWLAGRAIPGPGATQRGCARPGGATISPGPAGRPHH